MPIVGQKSREYRRQYRFVTQPEQRIVDRRLLKSQLRSWVLHDTINETVQFLQHHGTLYPGGTGQQTYRLTLLFTGAIIGFTRNHILHDGAQKAR